MNNSAFCQLRLVVVSSLASWHGSALPSTPVFMPLLLMGLFSLQPASVLMGALEVSLSIIALFLLS